MTTILINYNNIDHQIDASIRQKHTINQELVIMADMVSFTLVQFTNDTIDSVYIEEGFEGERRLVYFPYSLKEDVCRVIVEEDTDKVYLIRRGKSCLKRKCEEDEGEWKKKKVCENVKEVVFNFKEMLACILTKYWSREMEDSFKLEKVEKDSNEFEMLAGDFYQHMSYYGSNILEIQRVQNLDCLNKYINKYMEVMKKPQNSNKTIERRMYHGTPEQCVDKIVREGLDYRLAKSTGSLGTSAYFGDSPITSLNYIDLNRNEKLMLVCRVIVGTSVKGKPGLRRPPYIHKTLDLADSVYGDLGHDRIFGIFDLDQILVEYVIKFSIDDNKIKCLKLKNHMTQSNNNIISVSGNLNMKAGINIAPKTDYPNFTQIPTYIQNTPPPAFVAQGMKVNQLQNNIYFNNQSFPIGLNNYPYNNIPYTYSRDLFNNRYSESIYDDNKNRNNNVIIID